MCVFVVESSWWKCTTVSTVSPGNNKSLAEAPPHPHPPTLTHHIWALLAVVKVTVFAALLWFTPSWSFDDPATHVYLLIIVLSPLFSSWVSALVVFVGFCLLAPNHYLDDKIQGWLSLFIHWSSPWVLLCFSPLSWSWRRGVCGTPPTHPSSPPMTPFVSWPPPCWIPE